MSCRQGHLGVGGGAHTQGLRLGAVPHAVAGRGPGNAKTEGVAKEPEPIGAPRSCAVGLLRARGTDRRVGKHRVLGGRAETGRYGPLRACAPAPGSWPRPSPHTPWAVAAGPLGRPLPPPPPPELPLIPGDWSWLVLQGAGEGHSKGLPCLKWLLL